MTDSKYFTTTKKGELFELRADLVSDRKDKKKDAVKKVTFVSIPNYTAFIIQGNIGIYVFRSLHR